MISKISSASDVYNPKFVDNIRYRTTANILYMFFKIVSSNYTIKDINIIINKLKFVDAYPMNTNLSKLNSLGSSLAW